MDGLRKTRYPRDGSTHLAPQELGDGPLDIFEIESWVHREHERKGVPGMWRLYLAER